MSAEIVSFICGALTSAVCVYFLLQRKLFDLNLAKDKLEKDLSILEKNSEYFAQERQHIKQDCETTYTKILAEKDLSFKQRALQYEREVEAQKQQYEVRIKSQKQECETTATKILSEKEQSFKQIIAQYEREIAMQKQQYEARINAQKQDYDTLLQTQKNDHIKIITDLKNTTQETFKNIANDILKNKSEDLQVQNNKTIGNILAPFKENMDGLKNTIDTLNTNGTRNATSFEEQMKALNNTTQGMMQNTQNLTNALKGDKKLQGNWGEIVIKDILDTAGLIEGKHYVAQAKEMKLEDYDTGKRQMPDFVINLPNNKHIILDSKVSLVNYEQYYSTQNEAFLKEFIKNVQNQIADLSSKKYHKNEKLNAPDFVIMCIPIEPAYLLAINSDAALCQKALAKHIVLCGPSNLFAILQIVGNLWMRDNQTKNVKEIARRATLLYDKFGAFVKHLDTIGSSIQVAEEAYRKARGSLIDGKGNMAKQLEDINSLATKDGLLIDADIIENENTTQELIA